MKTTNKRTLLVLSVLLGLLSITAKAGNGPGIQCTPQETKPSNSTTVVPTSIHLGQTFVIEFPATDSTHPKDFLIRSPSGRSIFIVDEDAVSSPLMSPEAFMTCQTMTIDSATLTGTYWDNGEPHTVKAFSEKGAYTLYFADNLETEPDNTVSISRTVTVK